MDCRTDGIVLGFWLSRVIIPADVFTDLYLQELLLREEFKSSEANHFDPVTVFLPFLLMHDVVPLHRLLPLVLVVLV